MLGAGPEQQATADRERYVAQRQEEEHRDEDGLRREEKSRADLEPCARRCRIAHDERDDDEGARRA